MCDHGCRHPRESATAFVEMTSTKWGGALARVERMDLTFRGRTNSYWGVRVLGVKVLFWHWSLDPKPHAVTAADVAQVKDPTCGNCGKAQSAHYHEDRTYCFENTTGDIFTDDPSDDLMGSFLRERHPALYAQLVNEWRAENGHAPNA